MALSKHRWGLNPTLRLSLAGTLTLFIFGKKPILAFFQSFNSATAKYI
jgi:hypothetical protein